MHSSRIKHLVAVLANAGFVGCFCWVLSNWTAPCCGCVVWAFCRDVNKDSSWARPRPLSQGQGRTCTKPRPRYQDQGLTSPGLWWFQAYCLLSKLHFLMCVLLVLTVWLTGLTWCTHKCMWQKASHFHSSALPKTTLPSVALAFSAVWPPRIQQETSSQTADALRFCLWCCH